MGQFSFSTGILRNPLPTLRQIIDESKAKMAGNFAESEWMAGVWLAVEEVLSFSRKDLVARPESEIPLNVARQFLGMIDRFSMGEPIQYILGYSYFRYLKLHVNPAVLIPRPETEWLVSLVLEHVQEKFAMGVDACTGSGCIALSLAAERPSWRISAFDFSLTALQTAALNKAETKADVRFYQADALNVHQDEARFPLDFVVSNPPYVPIRESGEVEESVKMHEPSMAVFVDSDDAILFYKAIVNQYFDVLKSDGWFFFEIHPGSELLLKEFLEGLQGIRFWFEKDFKNLSRFLLVQKEVA